MKFNILKFKVILTTRKTKLNKLKITYGAIIVAVSMNFKKY